MKLETPDFLGLRSLVTAKDAGDMIGRKGTKLPMCSTYPESDDGGVNRPTLQIGILEFVGD